jgi:predicted Zn-dependent protease
MNIASLFASLSSTAEFFSLRFVEEDAETVAVRRGNDEPAQRRIDRGAMLTVIDRGGSGYAATSDLSPAGLARALQQAEQWARASAAHSVVPFRVPQEAAVRAHHRSPQGGALPARHDLAALLMTEDLASRIDERIVDSYASVESIRINSHYMTNHGGEIVQETSIVIPNIRVTAADGRDTQSRSLSRGYCQQGGLEVIERSGVIGGGARVANEALELLLAPNCPDGVMDALLMPDQMMLQIHESIGHPLELDRILGDERNFAGTSFVTLDMFGTYRYGSELLNVTFDPSHAEQLASYAYDDDGLKAEKRFLIRDGMLVQPLGSALSATRARATLGRDVAAVANSRSSSWNRAPIDRMANINVEPGRSTLDEMIAQVDNGILLETNLSWSIDDSRNKFQFGCERGQLIRNGRLAGIVKNPNYRGISANFWRSLSAVGDASTFEVMGTPYCGKGEPAQVVRVGHASPACLFTQVDVFGGAQ